MESFRRSRLARAAPILGALILAGHAAVAAPAQGVARNAPDCALAIASPGAPRSLAALRGSVVWVDFWASWCAPCAASFPFMGRLQQDFRGQGLKVVAIDMDERPDDAARFLARHEATFAVAGGRNEACASRFGVQTMPSSFLIDRAGIIRVAHEGFRAGEEAALRSAVSRALAAGGP